MHHFMANLPKFWHLLKKLALIFSKWFFSKIPLGFQETHNQVEYIKNCFLNFSQIHTIFEYTFVCFFMHKTILSWVHFVRFIGEQWRPQIAFEIFWPLGMCLFISHNEHIFKHVFIYAWLKEQSILLHPN